MIALHEKYFLRSQYYMVKVKDHAKQEHHQKPQEQLRYINIIMYAVGYIILYNYSQNLLYSY